jgi:hypothetical protein
VRIKLFDVGHESIELISKIVKVYVYIINMYNLTLVYMLKVCIFISKLLMIILVVFDLKLCFA